MESYMNTRRENYNQGEKIFLNFDKGYELKALEENDLGKSYEFIGSKEIEDRDGDTILISGISLENLGKNLPSFFNHSSYHLIGHVSDAKKVKKELRVTIFVLKDATLPSGVKVIDAIDSGSLKAVSIGFMLKKWEPKDVDDPWGGWIIKECELLEVSIVSIPANPEALLVKSHIAGMKDEDITKFFKSLDVTSPITASKDLPISETAEWDSVKALERVKEFVTIDDNTFNLQKFETAFMYTKTNKDNGSDFVFQFADVIEGKLTAVRAGLEEAYKSLELDKDINDKERARIKSIIKDYSEKMETPLEAFKEAKPAVITIEEKMVKAISDGFKALDTKLDTIIKSASKEVIIPKVVIPKAFDFAILLKNINDKESK